MALTTAQKRSQQKNQRYWGRREQEALWYQALQKKARTYERHIRRVYSRMMDNIQKEIDAFYGKYALAEGISMAEAKKRASKLDIEAYVRKAKQYVETKDFSAQANAEMKLYNLTMKVNRLELLKANIGLELVSVFDELQEYFEQVLTEDTLEEFERQAGILGESVIDPAEKAKSVVGGSWHNANFSERIWMNQDLLRFEVGKLLATGMIQGKNPRALARDLRKAVNSSVYNSERLMRTELARTQVEAQRQSFEANGFEEYEYIANGNACPICKELDGKHFKVRDMEISKNAPPMHPNCMCSTAPWEDDAEYEAWLSHLENGGTTEEWEKIKSTVAFEPKEQKGMNIYSKEEIEKMSNEAYSLVGKYVDRASKYSGKTNVVDELERGIAQKDWNCDISCIPLTSMHILMHEHIHARSISHYDENVYTRHQEEEEGAVELLAQEISKREGYPISESKAYGSFVEKLRDFRKEYTQYSTDMDFAKELIMISPVQREKWLQALKKEYEKNKKR